MSLMYGWCGVELYRRAGKEGRVQKQVVANKRMEEAVRELDKRGEIAAGTGPMEVDESNGGTSTTVE